MKHQASQYLTLVAAAVFSSCLPTLAQVNPAYEVATWRDFKASAVSYTFDDNTRNQLPVAIPLLNRYNFKATLFTITAPTLNANWPGLREASLNGHEVASHTVTHPDLDKLSIAQQVQELQQSQATIRANVPSAKCETIAYPNCLIGDRPVLAARYIAGRICSGVVNPSSPPDFYAVSSISTGIMTAITSAQHFNGLVQSARDTHGWCVFLLHGIDNDGGYSPMQSSELAGHLAFVDANRADYWVATFAEVVKYIKERDAVSITETQLTPEALGVVVTDNLPNNVYNVPITVRRALPADWASASITLKRKPVASTISTRDGIRYITFDAVPNAGQYILASPSYDPGPPPPEEPTPGTGLLWPNPFTDKSMLEIKGSFTYSVYSMAGQVVESGGGTDTTPVGATLRPGTYMVRVDQEGTRLNKLIVKL